MGDVLSALWIFSCLINLGFSFATFKEGTWVSFFLSLLLVPFGPVTLAFQWANFHMIQNQNLVLMADVVIAQASRIVDAIVPDDTGGQYLAEEVAAFSAATNEDGSLRYPKFDELREAMAELLSDGVASDLEEAYQIAASGVQ